MKNRIYFAVTANDAVSNAKEFNLSTHQIQNQFEEALNLNVKGIEKLELILNKDGDYLFSPPVEMFPFVFIDKQFDFDAYWAATEAERKAIVLDTLYESALDMCEKMKIDKAPFQQAYNKVKVR